MITANGKIFLITSTSAKLGRFIRHKGILFKYDRNLYVVHRTIKGVEIVTYEELIARHLPISLWMNFPPNIDIIIQNRFCFGVILR